MNLLGADVLLVDDDALMLQFMSKALLGIGRLRFARDGLEALAAIRQSLPELLVLDSRMPRLDGPGLLAQLQADPLLCRLPVIMVTSASDEALEAEALGLGAVDFIRKPFEPQRLLDRVRAQLRSQRLRGLLAPGDDTAVGERSVLVVDDDSGALNLIAELLTPLGARVQRCASGAEALTQMHRDPPDAVLIDIHMPEMDGFALCQAMLHDPLLSQVPVAFISVATDGATESKSFAAGACDFIAKPFRPTALQARVRNLLRLGRERRESARVLAEHWQRLGDNRVAELVELAREPIVSVDGLGRVALINKAAVALGVEAPQVLGKPAVDVLPSWEAMELLLNGLEGADRKRRAGAAPPTLLLCRGDGSGRLVRPQILHAEGLGAEGLTTVLLPRVESDDGLHDALRAGLRDLRAAMAPADEQQTQTEAQLALRSRVDRLLLLLGS